MIKKAIPILVIFGVWFIFSLPFFLKNNVPFASDYLVANFAPWNSYSELYGPVKNAAMPDVIGQIYPWKKFSIDVYKTGNVPLWNPDSFGGTPHLANYQSAVLSPFNVGYFIFPLISWWSVLVLLQPLLAGMFMYIYSRSLKQSRSASVISSLSFMFCGFIVSWMGYATLGYAILFLPLALFAIEKYYEKNFSRYLVLLSIILPLSFFSGHFQISLYMLIFVGAYLIYKYVQTKNIRALVFVLLALLLGLLLCSPQLFPTIELYGQSYRSTIFQKIEAIPFSYLPALLAPDYFGSPITRNSWFGHYAEWNGYIGIVSLLLALFTLGFIRRKGKILFFWITSIVFLLLAYDSWLLDILVFLKIPVLSTSAASRIIVLFSFSMAVLAGFGFDFLVEKIEEKKRKSIIVFIGVACLLIGLLWAISFSGILGSSDNSQIAKSNLRLPTLIFGAFVLTICVSYFLKKKMLVMFLSICLILLISVDLLRFATKWQSFAPMTSVYPEVGITKFYPKISGADRVFGNFGAEDAVYYSLPSVEGYDAVYIRRYGQFIASLHDGKLHDSYRSVVEYPLAGKYTLSGGNFLGIKYFVHKITDGQKGWEFPFWEYKPKSVHLIFDDGRYQVLENTNAFPRAFLVDTVYVENDPQRILSKMLSKTTNLKHQAVIEESLSSQEALGTGSARITSYTPNKVEINTSSKLPSFLVLTDVYYPGWVAKVDNKPVKILRADFAFRGIQLPSGEHTVQFVYEPHSFTYGLHTGIIGAVGVLVLGVINAKQRRTKTQK